VEVKPPVLKLACSLLETQADTFKHGGYKDE
jgi:hypothetical protein